MKEGAILSIKAKASVFESIVAPTMLYRCETLILNTRERPMINLMKINCLRSICDAKRKDRVKNALVRRRFKNKLSMFERADKGV